MIKAKVERCSQEQTVFVAVVVLTWQPSTTQALTFQYTQAGFSFVLVRLEHKHISFNWLVANLAIQQRQNTERNVVKKKNTV